MNNYDPQYLNIIKTILDTGIDRDDRTGIGSRAIWGANMHINLTEGFPIQTSRRASLRIAFEELMWMLRGQVDSTILKNKNINIWEGNTTREFLDSRKLNYLPVGHIGKGYGFQMRNFGGHYSTVNGITDYSKLDNTGVDQIKNLIESLTKDPHSRRHIVLHWNPTQLDDAALPSCHLYHQYQILDGKLNSSFVARSQDICFGTPTNIMFYSLLNHFIANVLGIEPGILYYSGMDVHIYNNQMDMAKELITRTWHDLPKLIIKKDLKTLDDILSLEFEDIELENYKCNPDVSNKPRMAI
ncbi:thymidylate synthase [Pseudomonas phage Deifobo]|nr:thymidylate synthase [Pseudomonas phage Deifobo]